MTEASLQAASKNKYRNKPTVVDGIKFASKAEAQRYGELKLLEATGKITGLGRQPRFKLVVNGDLIATYVADFRYYEKRGPAVVEDVKGYATRDFKLKARLFRALYPRWELRVVK